ncbi:MAG: hypothetical protein O3A93_02150 [Chloroflexi bacterium]|nr:hypothetical protein [Chloroflexota bacterium]MDA1270049.1 hypothetical protein [Chloroflexota bacterium]PKB58745.1 MAG: hypothetical protein BZY83_05365 [SAR202 cluster bacterium Casp-Chloro-G2]
MASDKQLTREEFDQQAERLGITGEPDYLDELYSQTRGVFISADVIRKIDVTDTEPDMAFIPKVN